MKILLIDDSRTMRNIQKKSLGAFNPVEFGEAGDGVEALSLVAAVPEGFDLVLVDWNMPNMDGITFVKRFREKNNATPVIMVTTEAEKVRIIEAIKAGVNNYVIKPFTAETLLEKVNQTLNKLKAIAA